MGTKRKKRIKVAIIGGGCAAMAAAFELTRPEHRRRYAVTVYQMGFRLGGKGASGRGPNDRIEEHGLHLWMGFYENAFRLMRECYAELDRDPEEHHIARWDDAFTPCPLVALAERTPHGDWEPWIANFPPMRGLPGDPIEEQSPFSIGNYLAQAAGLIGELIRSAHPRHGRGKRRRRPAVGDVAGLFASADELLQMGRLAGAAALFEATDLLRSISLALFPEAYRTGSEVLLRLVDAIAGAARGELSALVDHDPALERIWQVIDVILAIFRGVLLSGLLLDPRGFDVLDDLEWTDWLRQHGASDRSLDAGFMRGIYDLMFAFAGGDTSERSFSAAVALRGALRMFFTYRGALFWKMSAGMGDIVFAPLYQVLKRRGVRFRFFHRLTNLKLSPAVPGERPFIEAMDFDVQAKIQGGGEYQPLVPVRDLPCWPAEPDYAQLVEGERLKAEGWAFESPWEARRAGTKTLHVGEGFDLVVLGLSLGSVPACCGELIERLPRWKSMVEQVKTTGTQAFQIWMREDMRELGWNEPPVNLSGFVEPFDTWADMSHLAPEESWKGEVRSIAYFCSPLPGGPPPSGAEEGMRYRSAERDKVRARAIDFLNHEIGGLWPAAVRGRKGFRFEVLAGAPPEVHGEARFDSQLWAANVGGSDRYVLSVPGSSKYRISPLDLSVDNLTIAGDWTETGLNTGCVESAVMSGLLAAHAICGSPRLEDIIGYDHP
ncbi:MAG: NAD(P)-binding protein [Byssovorax sp.]